MHQFDINIEGVDSIAASVFVLFEWSLTNTMQCSRRQIGDLLASQSDAHNIAPHRDPNPSPTQSINQYLFFKTTPQDFLIEEG